MSSIHTYIDTLNNGINAAIERYDPQVMVFGSGVPTAVGSLESAERAHSLSQDKVPRKLAGLWKETARDLVKSLN